METVIGGLFNAVAFAGAGFLFSKLNHTGYEKEIKRHNKAMEKLDKDKEKWYEEEVKRKEQIEKLRQQLSDANVDINQTNMSLKTPVDINSRFKSLEKEYNTSEEPKLEDYYKESDEMKEYKILSFSIIGIGTGYIVYKFIK